MTLRERITIRAGCEEVWPWVADPARVSRWNPKLIAVDRDQTGPLRLGERFGETFRMNGRNRHSDCAVIELQEPGRLVIRHHVREWSNQDRIVDERLSLRSVGGGTRLVQEIDLGCSGIAWLLQFFMWLIHSTGEAVGKRYLVSLEELIESERCQADTAEFSEHQSGITKQ